MNKKDKALIYHQRTLGCLFFSPSPTGYGERFGNSSLYNFIMNLGDQIVTLISSQILFTFCRSLSNTPVENWTINKNYIFSIFINETRRQQLQQQMKHPEIF